MVPLRILGAALLCLGTGACCVAPPRPDAWLKVGWRSPTQAFETFQTAIRADSAELEYRSFSTGFRERNRISKLVWREARSQLRQRYPWLRKGLDDARLVDAPTVHGARAEAEAESHGTRIRIEFVREDFVELWEGDRLLLDELAPFEDVTLVQTGGDERRWFQGSVALPPGDASGLAITEFRIGREWKIDSLVSLESKKESASSRAEAAPQSLD